MEPRTFEAEMARNRAAYERHKEDIEHASPGQYAAIAQGRLIVLTPTFDEAVAALKELQPRPEHFLVFPVEEEPAFDLVENL